MCCAASFPYMSVMWIEIQLQLNYECRTLRSLLKIAPYEGSGTNHIDEIQGESFLYSYILLNIEESLIILLLYLGMCLLPFLH